MTTPLAAHSTQSALRSSRGGAKHTIQTHCIIWSMVAILTSRPAWRGMRGKRPGNRARVAQHENYLARDFRVCERILDSHRLAFRCRWVRVQLDNGYGSRLFEGGVDSHRNGVSHRFKRGIAITRRDDARLGTRRARRDRNSQMDAAMSRWTQHPTHLYKLSGRSCASSPPCVLAVQCARADPTHQPQGSISC